MPRLPLPGGGASGVIAACVLCFKGAGCQRIGALYLIVGIGTMPLRGPNNRTPIPIRLA